MHEVNLWFPFFGEQVIRKFLKEANIEIDREGFLYAAFQPMVGITDERKNLETNSDISFLTQEQISQYESALRGETFLKVIGLEDPSHLAPDKISAAANKFCQDETSI